MTTAAFSRQTKVVQRPALRRDLDVGGEVHDLRVRSTAILAAISLDESLVLLPLTGDGEIA
jgi:hypothetical protein